MLLPLYFPIHGTRGNLTWVHMTQWVLSNLALSICTRWPLLTTFPKEGNCLPSRFPRSSSKAVANSGIRTQTFQFHPLTLYAFFHDLNMDLIEWEKSSEPFPFRYFTFIPNALFYLYPHANTIVKSEMLPVCFLVYYFSLIFFSFAIFNWLGMNHHVYKYSNNWVLFYSCFDWAGKLSLKRDH